MLALFWCANLFKQSACHAGSTQRVHQDPLAQCSANARRPFYDLASTLQPLSGAIPGLDIVPRGRPARRTSDIPTQILDKLWRTVAHLWPWHTADAVEHFPLARRRLARLAHGIPHLARRTINHPAENGDGV